MLAHLKTNPLYIICLTETCISIDDTDTFSLYNEAHYNLCVHPHTSGRGGGVGMIVHKDLPSPSISPIILSYCDCISSTFNLQSNSLRIIVIYHPPKPDFSTFFDELSDLINDCLHHNEYKVMTVGDFN